MKPPSPLSPGALLIALLPLLAPAAPGAQEPAGPPSKEIPIEQWVDLDGVAIVVNSDPVTLGALKRIVEKRFAERRITTREELQQVFFEAQKKEVDSLLMRQAGEDLGFPKEAVDSRISDMMDERKQKAGGIYNMTENLREDSTTREEIAKELETNLYEQSFKRRVMGYGSSAERTSEDRYVRPGVLARQYRHIRRTGLAIDPLEQVGASPAEYELQILLLSPDAYGSLKDAQAAAQRARAALLEGNADWDDLIDTIGTYSNRGLTGPHRIEDLRMSLDPGDNRLVQFIMEGKQDVYSPVMPFPEINPATGQRRVAAFAIYRLVGREPAKLPDFGASGVQNMLRRFLQNEADNARLNSALEKLKSSAYIWYEGIEEVQAARAKAEARRQLEIEKTRQHNAEILSGAREKAPAQGAEPGTEAPAKAQGAPQQSPR